MYSDVAVNVVASPKDGNFIVTGDEDGKVVVWDTSLQERCEAAEHHGRMITALDVSSLYVASGSSDGTVRVWKMQEPGCPPLAAGPSMRQGSIPVSSVKFSPAGNHIASACAQWGCNVNIWHRRTRDQIASIGIGGLCTHSLAWSSDGQRLFAGCSDGSISCLDTLTRKPFSKVVKPRPGDDSISSLHVSNGDRFLVSFSAPGRTVDIWDIHDTPPSGPMRSYSRCVSASISPDDFYLANSGNDTKITIRRLSEVVEAPYFFYRLAPSPSYSEPFTYISPAAHRAWKSGELEQAEHILSREIEEKRDQGFASYARANRALVRIRRGDSNGALDDAGKTVLPAIARVAKAMAFISSGKQREAIDAFGSVCHGGAKDFVECVKSVALFELQFRDATNCETQLTELVALADDSCPWVKTRNLLLLAERYIRRGECNEGLRLLTEVPDLNPFLRVPEAKILPLLFGWDIYDLGCMVQQLICRALFVSGRTREVNDFLHVNENCLDEENEAGRADLGWLCEKLGDEAICHGNYDDAITWYSVSLGLYPESRVRDCGSEFAEKCLPVSESEGTAIAKESALMASYPPGSARLLVKRSKARAFKEFWRDALEDADQAIDMDKSCPWGYERRYAALRALQRHQEATETLGQMVTKVEEAADPRIRQFRSRYVAPAEIIQKIDKQIGFIREISPLVLIDVRTGSLCDADERVRIFKLDPLFHELVSSMSMQLDSNRIVKVVTRYFRYVMFSHTWEGQEPTFQNVSEKPVYEFNPHPLRCKLRCFCETVRNDPEGYLWAWSDTCCIDKTIETIYRKSIRSMYSWYEGSALTIVLLSREPAPPTLKSNRWMTRAWTLQELLAPKSIRLYDKDWKLYREDTTPNHKKSPDIKQELADAIGVAQDTIVDFSPKSLSIRAKLRLASTREATEKADIAYALIGIFSSDLTPEYRDPGDALGLLLEEIVHRQRDARAVLDWIGESSQFNSCLPAQISAYRDPPYMSPRIPEIEMEARVAELRAMLPHADVISFFNNLSTLGSIGFARRRLSLPCITFSVSVDTVGRDEASSASNQIIVYQAAAAVPGQLKLQTSCTHGEVVLVYPWIRDLLAQTDNLPELDDYTRALQLFIHLEQPFRALLLVKQSYDTYKRVATDEEILIPRRKIISLKDIGMKVLEIL
ncbi:hypothetical protein F5141DRAFT_481323 [Pisolithus sp. B1]|nr:hypothetical protein F5141DRAFT_481323 [Pisolithus sp. B1]